jgi:hypothetical protein
MRLGSRTRRSAFGLVVFGGRELVGRKTRRAQGTANIVGQIAPVLSRTVGWYRPRCARILKARVRNNFD